jgi:hypothetical protein
MLLDSIIICMHGLFDLSIWQFHMKYCLVWLKWEGVDG